MTCLMVYCVLSIEDGSLMTFIQLGLIFLYVCVLVIKSCDLPAGRTVTAEAEDVARTMCSTYGFGDSPEGDQANPV